MKNRFIRRNLSSISKNEENKLVNAIIRIAYIIYNSGIIVGEKLEMPNSVLFSIRLVSSRASGYASSEMFVTRDLKKISSQEKSNLVDAINDVAKITNNDFANVAKKLEISNEFLEA